MLKTSFIPWLITVLMAVYVWFLTDYGSQSNAPEPDFNFYDTAVVAVRLPGEGRMVAAEYHNLMVGDRQQVEARQVSREEFRLTFRVNSPRPALLYIDEMPVEVFLIPGDTTLRVQAAPPDSFGQLSEVVFSGNTASLCQYYRLKRDHFQQQHLRNRRSILSANDVVQYGNRLDSMAARELAFLAEQEVYASLPDWFVNFEKNEVLYQKAYLKLSQAGAEPLPEDFFDPLPVNQAKAEFSYYYYLYVEAFIRRQAGELPADPEERLRKLLGVSANLLKPPVHDVFWARTLYNAAMSGDSVAARTVLDEVRSDFDSRRFVRYLNYKLPGKK